MVKQSGRINVGLLDRWLRIVLGLTVLTRGAARRRGGLRSFVRIALGAGLVAGALCKHSPVYAFFGVTTASSDYRLKFEPDLSTRSSQRNEHPQARDFPWGRPEPKERRTPEASRREAKVRPFFP